MSKYENQDNPLVSVIVPIYNVYNYLKECLDSIRKQKYTNLEVILVNDGSLDSSGDICKKIIKEDNRFLYFEKENGGLSSARNFGIERCTGEYMIFIDSDDYISEKMIASMLSCLIKYDADVCCCNYDFVNEKSEYIKKHRINIKQSSVYEKESAIKKLLSEDYYKCYAWNKLYKKKLFNEISYPKGKLYEDIVTAFKVFTNSNRIVFSKEILYHYRVRQTSITKEKFHLKKYDLLEQLQIVYNNYCENSEEIIAGIALYYLYFIDDMITAEIWDNEVYNQYCDFFQKLEHGILYYDVCSMTRKLQMLLCKKNIRMYKKIYLFLNKLKDKI